MKEITIVLCSAAFFCIGISDGVQEKDCIPKSILGYVIPVYWAGCELTKPRFK